MSVSETPDNPDNINQDSILKEIFAGIKNLPVKEQSKIFRKITGASLNPNTSTYFHERYALQLKPDLDALIEHCKDGKQIHLSYPYAEYPQWRGKTLYLYISNGFRYLCEHLDPDNTYKELKDKITICQTKTGVRIRLKGATNYNIKAKFISPDEDKEDIVEEKSVGIIHWKEAIFQFMERDDLKMGEKIDSRDHYPELELTPDEVSMLKDMFVDNEQFMAVVDQHGKFFVIRRAV